MNAYVCTALPGMNDAAIMILLGLLLLGASSIGLMLFFIHRGDRHGPK